MTPSPEQRGGRLSSHIIEAKDGSTFTATTDHAWEEPRGEVYIGIKDEEGEEFDFALTPKQARDLSLALTKLASHAATKPAATLTEFGDRIDNEEESA